MTQRDEAAGNQTGEDQASQPAADPTAPHEPLLVDIDVAQPARVRDAWVGGSDNFAVDRSAVEELTDTLPGGSATALHHLEAIDSFRSRAVRYLVAEAGLRQLLQVGTGIPKEQKAHETAQKVAPDCRIVYCFNDPVALAHAHELRSQSAPEGAIGFIHGSLQNPTGMLGQAAATLDLNQPVGVLVAASIIPDDEDPWSSVAELMAGLPAGSHLVVGQHANDIDAENVTAFAERYQKLVAERRLRPMTFRSQREVERFFNGLELVEPGVVPIDHWHPDGEAAASPDKPITPYYGVVGKTL